MNHLRRNLLTSLLGLAISATTFAQQQTKIELDPQLSLFGIGSSSACDGNHPVWMPKMAAIGIRDVRALYGSWGVERVEGTFDFTKFDERIAYDQSLGVQTGVLFNGLPPWKRTDKGLPVNCLPEWSAMVKATVKHTKGRVKLFEVWNEAPNGTAKNQTASDYAKVLNATYDAAKSENPDAMIGMAAKSAHINYLDSALVAGAKGHYDYLTFHPYEILGFVTTHPGCEPMYLSIVPNARKMLAKRDPAKTNVPVIFTEIGVDTRRYPDDKQSWAVLKTYIMGLHQGVSCINYYEGMDGDSGPLGLLDKKANPRLVYYALGRLIENFGRHPTSLGWIMLNDKHYAFLVQGAKGPVLATWAATANPEEVDFGKEVEVVDLTADTHTKTQKYKLTLSPVLVYGLPENTIAQATANKGKPLPWGGDYSHAKSVSVTFADKYVEKGLHTAAADSIARDVEAYGGNQRSGEIPKGGHVYYIDPNFLSYDTVPIEITAMVKRNDKNDPANFTFEYEAAAANFREGYKKVQPQEIPEGDQWHKLTWRIDDSQFVGTWAFHFRVTTEAKKYRIQSMTVTRLDR